MMSSVEFVRNPAVNTAVYRWEAVGLDALTRQNKLTSLPFWIPNATTRRHQFKLVLLRGLVPSTDPSSDAFGLIVELIPPPPSPTGAHDIGGRTTTTSSSSLAHSSEFPGGCAVTCEVLSLEALDGRRTPRGEPDQQAPPSRAALDKAFCSTKTAVVDADNAQICFVDFIPADILSNTRYISGTPKSLTLQVTIETGISVPLHQVATTAYSFFSSLSSSVTQLLGTTTHLAHEGRESLSAMLSHAAAAAGSSGRRSGGAAATTPSASASPATGGGVENAPHAMIPPWDQPPEEWSSRTAGWRSLLCVRLAGLDGTYRHGVEKTLSADEVALLTEVGLADHDLWSLYTLFDFDRDVQENLLTAPVLRARRYALVPAKIKEETFWANYFWKVHCVGLCVTERQVSAVIAVLCTPLRWVDTELSTSVEALLRLVTDAAEINAVLRDFLMRNEAGEPWCTVVAESARHCVAVLQASASSLPRTDLSAHKSQLLMKALSELKATLSLYGDALSTPPSTPCIVPSATSPLASSSSAAAVIVDTEVTAVPSVELAPSLATHPSAGEGEAEKRTVAPTLQQPAPVETTATFTETASAGDDVGAVEKTEHQKDDAAMAGAAPPAETAAEPPSSTAAVPPPPVVTAVQFAVEASTPPRSEEARSSSRIEFAKMPWEEEEG
jgi:hypothetical protein